MSLHIGFGAFSGQVPMDGVSTVADTYRNIFRVSRLAEAVGFDSLWCSEHHGAADSHLPSPVVLLAAMAAVTNRIGLGTGVVLAPFQHPLRFAEDCAVVDQLSAGRLMIGMASGWWDEEFAAFGIPVRERADRTAELAAICRAAWTQDRFSFEGKHSRFVDVRVTPKPAGSLPLLMGGTAPQAIERAARRADGYTGTGTPQAGLPAFAEQVAMFDRALEAEGRDPSTVPIGFHTNVWVSPNGEVPQGVFEAMWNQIGAYLAWHDQQQPTRIQDLPRLDEASLRKRAFLGTPTEVIEQVRPWIEAFVDRDLHIIFRLHYPGMRVDETEPTMRLFATEVMPELRAFSGRGASALPGGSKNR